MFVFCLGTGCCGSSLVQEILARHDDVGFLSNVDDRLGRLDLDGRLNGPLYRHVPQRWTRKGRVRFAPSEGYRALAAQVSPLLSYPGRSLTAEDATPWLSERFAAFFQERRQAQHTPVFLHKFTGQSRAGFIAAALPGARFIHIVRDGRAVASSFMRQSWWAGEHGRSQSWAVSGLPPAYRDEWERSGRSYVLLAGLAWKSMIDDHEEARKSLPEADWLELRYEDVLTDPTPTFAAMLQHMGLEVDAEFRRTLDGYALDNSRAESFRQELDTRSLALLDESLGGHLERLGYSSASSWPREGPG